MAKRRLTRLLGIGWISLVLGLAQPAQGQRDHGSANESTEVLIGSYHCGVSFDSGEAFAWYGFETSGDIFQRTPYLYRYYATGTPAPDFCDPVAAASTETLTQSGCSVGPTRARSDETGTSRDFEFVCHARRSGIIAIIAKITEQHLTGSP